MSQQTPSYPQGPYHVLAKGKGIWSIHPPVQPYENPELAERFKGLRPTICTVYGGCIENADDVDACNREGEAIAHLLAASYTMVAALKKIKWRAYLDGFESGAEMRKYLEEITAVATAAINEADHVVAEKEEVSA